MADIINIPVDLDNLTPSEQKQFRNLLGKASVISGIWKPKYGDHYYYLMDDGTINDNTWTNSAEDEMRFEINNCIPTEGKAMVCSKKQKILAQWERLSIESGEPNNPWDKTHDHWTVCCDFRHAKKLEIQNLKDTAWEEHYFASQAAVEAAVEEIGEENVLRYVLGVTNDG